ncbi:MAG: radical SAM protein [Chitinispirillaceae bacterium]|nr:radical SAM protein [Chitinispirillaceae bacterium]
MDTLKKLQILSDASQYDLSCACGTKEGSDHRRRSKDGTWLYPVSLPRGGTSIMLKTLMSNVCVNDCKYCPYRYTRDTLRCTLSPDEVAKIFMEYVRTKHIMGIFLSSGVIGSPDNTMMFLTDAAKIIRYKYNYKGYIHLKIIPGSSSAAIEEALRLASAVSINIETPGEAHLKNLSTKKNFIKDIIEPLKKISYLTSKEGPFAGIKQTTQFIVGASNENDVEILKYVWALYKKLNLSRVYYSAYQSGLGDVSISGKNNQTHNSNLLMREHRLYQADYLIRKYKFSKSDFIVDSNGLLSIETDPKRVWADHHPEFFPVSINKANKYQLMRVPGIGPITAQKILSIRKEGRIMSLDTLPVSVKKRELIKKYLTL